MVVLYEDSGWNANQLRYIRFSTGGLWLHDPAVLQCSNTLAFEYTCLLDLNQVFAGPRPGKFYIYFNVEEGVERTCSNGAVIDPLLHCNDLGQQEIIDIQSQMCNTACGSCYGVSRSKTNCMTCAVLPDFFDYFATNSQTEIICQEKYEVSQIRGILLSNPLTMQLRYADCDNHQIYKLPGFLMPTYRSDLPNWICMLSASPLNLYGVTKSPSLEYGGYNIGSHSYGEFQCLLPCEHYPYLQIYSDLCNEYHAVWGYPLSGTFKCCRYGASDPTCKLSCFEDPSLIPDSTDPNACTACNWSTNTKRIMNLDLDGNPLQW